MSNSTTVKPGKAKGGFVNGFVGFFDKWFPNSMVFVFLLTLVVAILSLIFCRNPIFVSSPEKMSLVDSWVKGFWKLLSFAMQMSLVMVTGYVLASAPPVKRGLMKIAKIPKSQMQAVIMMVIVTFVLNWIHWGIGMMGAILFGREILSQSKIQGYKVHKNSIVAVMYCLGCSAIGISQAAPLFASSPGYLASLVPAEWADKIPNVIPMADTVLTGKIIIQCLILGLMCFLVIIAMMPKKDENIEEISDDFAKEIANVDDMTQKVPKTTPALWFNNSIWLNLIVGGAGLIWGIRLLATQGFIGLSLDNYNFIMLMLGVILCGTPERFSKIVAGAVPAIWGVVIQFPFYAGIFGLIAFTGLNGVIVSWFVAIADAQTFPVVCFIYSAILNVFVPSGGSKFVIEAPYIMSVAADLGSDFPATIMAYNCGDLTTNLIQPFWALPYMAMFKMEFKDILPYTFIICAAAFIINLFYIGFVYVAGGGL